MAATARTGKTRWVSHLGAARTAAAAGGAQVERGRGGDGQAEENTSHGDGQEQGARLRCGVARRRRAPPSGASRTASAPERGRAGKLVKKEEAYCRRGEGGWLIPANDVRQGEEGRSGRSL